MNTDSQLELFETPEVSLGVYCFLLKPAEPTYSLTLEVKAAVDAHLKNSSYKNKLPHVTLLQFSMNVDHETRLHAAMKRVILPKNLGAVVEGIKLVKSNSTIVLSLSAQEAVHEFVENLSHALAIDQVLPKKKSLIKRTKDLRITVGKQLPVEHVDALMKTLEPMAMQGAVIFNELVLLRSEAGSGPWDTVATFPLT